MRAGRALGHASAMLNHAAAERLGLNPNDWECLSMLFEHGAVTAGRLAELTGLTTGAITGLVDRLESAGYARRRRDTCDRRRVIVELVPSAMVDVMPLLEPMLAELAELHEQYSAEQLTLVVESLSRAASVLRRHALRIRAGNQGNGRPDPA